MARYLTPSKIGLLALTSIYTESVVPAAATVPILSFLVSNLLPATPARPSHEAVADLQDTTAAIDALQQATISHASGIPGRTIWDLLLNKLWKIDSLDSLHAYFDSLSLLLQMNRTGHIEDGDLVTNRILLSRRSPLGVFVRRAQLEFSRLRFQDGVSLWRSFLGYRLPTLAQWKKRNPNASSTSFDVNLENDGFGVDGSLGQLAYRVEEDGIRKGASISAQDIGKLLEHQVDQMQSRFFVACAHSTLFDISQG
ncbi:MAG: hypothetical protein Q9217_003979 [Psora testacea]